MTRYGQIGWRMAAMAAFAGTAALAIILTRAPVGTDAALSSSVTGRACPTSGLEAWLGLGAAGLARPTGPVGAGRASLSVQAIQARSGVPGYATLP
jgi:hypothetical protein